MQKTLTLTFNEYNDINALSPDDHRILEQALSATKNAYAPYSNFKVGAAAILDNGEIVAASNQENASYGVTLCAERVLLSLISTLNSTQYIKTIAVSYINENGHDNKPITPCGICRQALLEHQIQHKHSFRIILGGKTGKVWILEDASQLLPMAFSPNSLD